MKNLFKAALAVCAISLTTGVNAGVIVGDKEWRQVTETVNFSWNDFSGVCSPSDGSCSGDLTNGTVGTVSFDSWTWASQGDVAGLFQGLNGWDGPLAPATAFLHQSQNSTWAPFFFETLGFLPTETSGSRLAVLGLTTTDLPAPSVSAHFARVEYNELSTSFFDTALTTDEFAIVSSASTLGGWFYRAATTTPSVPAPPTLALLLVPALLIVASRKPRTA